MNKPILKILLLLCLISLWIAPAKDICAKGLSVSPGAYEWHSVKVGTLVEFPMTITIRNHSEVVRSYTLRVVKSSGLKVNTREGFEELPSRKWVSFNRKRVPVNPEEEEGVKMFIEIPQEEKNLNQNWEFFVEVREYTTGGEIFALACYIKIILSTESAYTEK